MLIFTRLVEIHSDGGTIRVAGKITPVTRVTCGEIVDEDDKFIYLDRNAPHSWSNRRALGKWVVRIEKSKIKQIEVDEYQEKKEAARRLKEKDLSKTTAR